MLGIDIALLRRRLPFLRRFLEIAGIEGGKAGLVVGPRAARCQEKDEQGCPAEPSEM
jgi:hypothetical protein